MSTTTDQETQAASATVATERPTITRVAVGVDGYPEGRDAAALGAALAHGCGAELMLVAVEPQPLVVLPRELNWTTRHHETDQMLREVRDAVAPDARMVTETGLSVAQTLEHVAQRTGRDLLIVGSSRHAAEGTIAIGKRTRQLLHHCQCALAIAPRGLHKQPSIPLARIAVGYDGGPESAAALALAESLAQATGAELLVRAVVDDRLPPIGFSALAHGGADHEVWEDCLLATHEKLVGQLDELAARSEGVGGVPIHAAIVRGRPADTLLDLSEHVDLLVIGSRRWGPAARVLLGSTGEAVLHGARCPVLAVPRPAA